MKCNWRTFLTLVLAAAALFILAGPAPSFAAEQKAGQTELEQAPEPVPPAAAIPERAPSSKVTQEKMPVAVEFQGTDGIGQRLVYHLKEVFEKSAIFRLSGKDEKKVKVLVSTAEEFAERPNTSSVYSVIWLYSENEKNLKHFLTSAVGLVHAATVKESAEELAGKTHEITSSFGYLFE